MICVEERRRRITLNDGENLQGAEEEEERGSGSRAEGGS
jgi:hypothetical protein